MYVPNFMRLGAMGVELFSENHEKMRKMQYYANQQKYNMADHIDPRGKNVRLLEMHVRAKFHVSKCNNPGVMDVQT